MGFAEYDQLQKWTEQSSGSRVACFEYEEQTNIGYKSDAGRSEKKSLTVQMQRVFKMNVKIIKGTCTHWISAGSQKA